VPAVASADAYGAIDGWSTGPSIDPATDTWNLHLVPRRGIPATVALTPTQTAGLSDWLNDHRWGWGALLYTPPPGYIFTLSIKHIDGSGERIEFYPSYGAIMWKGDGGHVQSFSAQDITKLRLILEGSAG